MRKTVIPNLFFNRGKLLTRNLTPGRTFFGERTWKEGDGEYRVFDPNHSKLGAAFMKGVKEFGLKKDSLVLYLGASHGYTPSFVSDMVAAGGVFCVEFSPTVCRDLVFVCEQRGNMAPILADANHPESYENLPLVDVVFQDISQRNQVRIFLKNMQQFGKNGSTGLLALKTRSIDATQSSRSVVRTVRRELDNTPWITVIGETSLSPYEKDHGFFVVKKKA